MAYATIDQLYEYLPQLPVGGSDALLEDLLERATAIITEALGFAFGDYGERATARDVLHKRGKLLFLPAYKQGSITKVEMLSGRGLSDESAEEVNGYVDDGRWLYHDNGWAAGCWYRVTALWGYGPPPASISEVTLEVAVNIWRGRDASQWSGTIGVEGQGSMQYNRALTWAQRSIIDGVRADREGIIHA